GIRGGHVTGVQTCALPIFGAETRDSVSRLVESSTGVALDELHAPTAARSLHAPLLVLHDEDDREVPLACGQQLADAWPGARLERSEERRVGKESRSRCTRA